jgi:hypothetical protein
MKMIKFVSLIAIIGFATVLQAQKSQNKKGRIDGQRMAIIEFSEELGLSPTQKAAIWDANVAHVKELKEKKSNGELVDKEKREALITAHESKVNGILTPTQQSKYLELKEAKKEENKARAAENQEKRRAVKEELDAYYNANVLPVMSKKRMEFDRLLSNDDKAVIADAKAKRQEKKEKWQSKMDKKGDVENNRGRQKMKSNFKKSRDGQNEDHRKGMGVLNQIIEKHSSELERIWADTESQRIVWEGEMSAIKQKAMAKDNKVKGKENREKSKDAKRANTQNKMKWANFLLMDVK